MVASTTESIAKSARTSLHLRRGGVYSRLMLNRICGFLSAAVLAAICVCVPAFGQGAFEGYELPNEIDVAPGWEPYVLSILAVALICVCAFKKAKRTHLD
ncbi:MAG: hypothetical protein HZA50_18240 [Planctomycetes bacterium]|nr:hypothetical protein [Planctomycetota bacterium]